MAAKLASKGTCRKEGCTVADTGICLLSHVEITACPSFRADIEPRESGSGVALLPPSDPVPVQDNRLRQFHLGLELGTDDALEITQARYSHLVGIIGSWNAGKTCFLLSLYLMASRGALPDDYLFAGSLTLQGFEQRARRMRKWVGGQLPNQLTDHTILSDPRQAALLHIGLRQRHGTKRRFDVMLTDLPGEWSKNLVDRADTASRLFFLRRADGIIMVIDGPLLNSITRHSELQRSKHLLERLQQSVGIDPSTPLILLVSKCDQLQMVQPVVVDELRLHAASLGFAPIVIMSAAFSRTPETVPNGIGVFEALEKILLHEPALKSSTVASSDASPQSRNFLNFQYRGI